MRDDLNIIPVFLAILVHALVFVAMVFAIDLTRPQRPATPLAINATLVAEADVPRTPDPEPEPEPEPLEPEPAPEPDVDEQRRRELEEQKRQQELREEQARQERLKQEQERIRREQEEERRRQQQAAEERRTREEAEKERQRLEAERKRQEDIERQRAENERKRREAEEAERQRRLQAELAEEEQRLLAMQSGEMARYVFAIQQKIQRNWIQPPSAHPGIECVVLVRQLPGGEVVGVQITSCNGDAAVQRSIEAAIYKASPLPEPETPALFDRNLRITVKPEQ